MNTVEELRELSEKACRLKEKDMLSTLKEKDTERELVEPFIEALGYKFGLLEGEVERQPNPVFARTTVKCDYAIKKDDERIVLIEAKRANDSLVAPSDQLSDYFGKSKVWLCIYTNGIEYRFYSGYIEKNIKQMDEEPFLTLNLLEFDEAIAEMISTFAKDRFDPNEIRELAKERKFEQKYETAIHNALCKELKEPSEELCKLLINKIDAEDEELERLKPLVKKVANQILNRPSTSSGGTLPASPVTFSPLSSSSNQSGIPIQCRRYKHSEPRKAVLLRDGRGQIRLDNGSICAPSDAYVVLWGCSGNGWTKWEYYDQQNKELRPIDKLRGLNDKEQIQRAGASMGYVPRPSSKS